MALIMFCSDSPVLFRLYSTRGGTSAKTLRSSRPSFSSARRFSVNTRWLMPDRFIDISQFVEIQPAVNQVETHVFQQQKAAREIMQKYHTQIMSWGPFAEGRNNFFHNETLQKIGAEYGKSVAQVALRFLTQEGVVVIPKSVHKERMEENFNIFDFELSAADMEKIRALDTGKSLFFSHYDPATFEFLTGLGK